MIIKIFQKDINYQMDILPQKQRKPQSTIRRSSESIKVGNKTYSVWEGPRGGVYIKRNGKLTSLPRQSVRGGGHMGHLFVPKTKEVPFVSDEQKEKEKIIDTIREEITTFKEFVPIFTQEHRENLDIDAQTLIDTVEPRFDKDKTRVKYIEDRLRTADKQKLQKYLGEMLLLNTYLYEIFVEERKTHSRKS